MWPRAFLFLLIAYLAYRVYKRVIQPFRTIKKDFEEQVRQGHGSIVRDDREEGEVRVEKKDAANSKNNSSDGEYVDFEEVD